MSPGRQRSRLTATWLGVLFCLGMQAPAATQQKNPPAPAQPPAAAAPAAAAPATAPAATAPAAAAPAPATAPAAAPAAEEKPFHLHAFHLKEAGLDCSTCHVPVKDDSVVLQRPGHDQCMVCHADAFGDQLDEKICKQCHSSFPPTSSDDLFPYPRYKGTRALLTQFSHARHTDPKGRVDPHTGYRGDCTFCHKFDAQGAYGTFPGHAECTSCHSKPGMKPMLSPASTTDDCRGCHNPEEIENPDPAKKMLSVQVLAGKYNDLRFSHVAHLIHHDEDHLTCMTCHYAITRSTQLSDLILPNMLDCAQCHEKQKTVTSKFRMTNCQSCHTDKVSGPTPGSHTLWVKPAFHTENFRLHHAAEASAPDAKCFVCHTNVVLKTSSSAASNDQCLSCHQVMQPASHTARWRDDVHGKYAALDRTSCADCHTTDYCSRCHNEVPRSHLPLALFKGGAHARLAMLNERSCLTCHTFENTCAECHTRGLQ